MFSKWRKKAMLESKIVKLVLLITSFILIFAFIYQFYAKSTEFAGEEACHDSIVLTQVLAEKVSTGEYHKPWPATCKTQDKVIKAKGPEEAKKGLAELMSWCWYMVGEGAIKPFDKDIFYGGRKCFVCYTAQFPNLEGTINQQDFMFYLQQNGKKDRTYYDYLKYEEDKVIQTPLTAPINNKGVYVIVYSSPSDPTLLGPALGCLAPAGGSLLIPAVGTVAAGGVWAGCTAVSYVAQFLPKEDLVYVADVNQGEAGCYGTWYTGAYVEEVQSS